MENNYIQYWQSKEKEMKQDDEYLEYDDVYKNTPGTIKMLTCTADWLRNSLILTLSMW